MCEHPEAPPGYGESFTARMLEALASNPEVWAKTVFILNYDENDGFFDHVPPLVPAIHPSIGKSTADTEAENYFWEPVGFGPRVPLIVVSPWTRGGFVNSQLQDHTSVIRFLEERFGVMEPNISPWRRAVSGDLTSLFDFAQADDRWTSLPQTSGTMAQVDASAKLAPAKPLYPKALPKQEPGQRPARPLPYDFDVTGAQAPNGFALSFDNRGGAGAGFTVYSANAGEGPWYYMVGNGKSLSDTVPLAGVPDLSVYGSNGFFRQFRGADPIGVSMRYDAPTQSAVLILQNTGTKAANVSIHGGYGNEKSRAHAVASGAQIEDRWAIAENDHWYDFTITDGKFLRRLAGHIETGKPSKSDPAIGRG
jgi:phospholipase C